MALAPKVAERNGLEGIVSKRQVALQFGTIAGLGQGEDEGVASCEPRAVTVVERGQ